LLARGHDQILPALCGGIVLIRHLKLMIATQNELVSEENPVAINCRFSSFFTYFFHTIISGIRRD